MNEGTTHVLISFLDTHGDNYIKSKSGGARNVHESDSTRMMPAGSISNLIDNYRIE
jgi:hypothetical protein